jgi:hypothetical protein
MYFLQLQDLEQPLNEVSAVQFGSIICAAFLDFSFRLSLSFSHQI